MTGAARCPACKGSVPAGAFQCPRCELLLGDLNDQLYQAPGEGSVVQALFERPAAGRAGEGRGPTHERPHSGTIPPETARPRVLSRLKLSNMRLTRLEASVVGLCDGSLSVRDIAAYLDTPVRELQGVLQGLASLGVVSFPPVARPEASRGGEAGAEDDDGPPTVKFDLNELDERLERHRAKVAQQRAAARPPPPAPRSLSRVTAAASAHGKQPALTGQNPLEQAIKLERSGRGVEALRYLELAISRSEDPAPLYNRLAIVLIRERLDFRSAERMLIEALALAPGNPVYEANLQAVRRRQAISTQPNVRVKPRR